MNSHLRSRQFPLFSYEFPGWKALTCDQQQALEEILSLMLERALHQAMSDVAQAPPTQSTESDHV